MIQMKYEHQASMKSKLGFGDSQTRYDSTDISRRTYNSKSAIDARAPGHLGKLKGKICFGQAFRAGEHGFSYNSIKISIKHWLRE